MNWGPQPQIHTHPFPSITTSGADNLSLFSVPSVKAWNFAFFWCLALSTNCFFWILTCDNVCCCMTGQVWLYQSWKNCLWAKHKIRKLLPEFIEHFLNVQYICHQNRENEVHEIILKLLFLNPYMWLHNNMKNTLHVHLLIIHIRAEPTGRRLPHQLRSSGHTRLVHLLTDVAQDERRLEWVDEVHHLWNDYRMIQQSNSSVEARRSTS